MKFSPPLRAFLVALGLACVLPARADVPIPPDFPAWLDQVRAEAAARGISRATIDAALTGVEPVARVIELDQRQPEFIDTFWNYLDRRVNPRRLAQGERLLREHAALLREIQHRHGIPPTLLIAFWGLETDFGGYLGDIPVPAALVTLAYDHRRAAFFREELFEALRILDEGHIAPADMKGSWAGAMGQMQFMPSTFRRHAIDGDGDGRKDIWNSLPDAFHSAANYLRQAGWRPGELWGREVRLPPGFDWEQALLANRKPLSAWAAMGVRRADGQPLPKVDLDGAILLPQGQAGPAFLVYRNFDVIMAWNRSIHYALAVGHLADRLAGKPAFQLGRAADNRRLSREQLLTMQQELNARGFDAGEPDGIPGTRTRAAIRAWQKLSGLPADGHPSVSVLERLTATSSP